MWKYGVKIWLQLQIRNLWLRKVLRNRPHFKSNPDSLSFQNLKGLQFESQSGLNIFHSVSLDLMFVVSENIPLFG